MSNLVKEPTIKVVYDRKNYTKNADGERDMRKPAAITIEVYHNRKRLFINTGIKVCANQFYNGIVIRHNLSMEYNDVIKKQINKIREIISGYQKQGIEFQLSDIKDAFYGLKENESVKDEIEGLRQRESVEHSNESFSEVSNMMFAEELRCMIREELVYAINEIRTNCLLVSEEQIEKLLGVDVAEQFFIVTKGVLNSFSKGATTLYSLHDVEEILIKFGIEHIKALSDEITQIRKPIIPQKTYLMVDDNTNMVKIGKSINPKLRESTLQSEKPTIRLLYVCEDLVEDKLHEEYASKRVRGEWFALTSDEVNKIVKEYGFYEVK